MIKKCLLFLPLVAGAGCESQPVNKDESVRQSDELSDKVVFEKGLAQKLEVKWAQKDEKNGFMRVQIDLRNKSTLKQVIKYKYEWFDESGMMVAETDSTWVELALFPGETRSILGTAGSMAATDFRFKAKDK